MESGENRERVKQAFLEIKRSDFVPKQWVSDAEINKPLPIGFNQTISQPSVTAFMIENLSIKRGYRILDIGSGSGFTTAILSYLVGSKGKVIAIERIKELKDFGESNVKKYNFISKGIAEFILGDGYKGCKEEAPFDRILVSAALSDEKDLPKTWFDQLSEEGVILVPIGGAIVKYEKTREGINKTTYNGFSFVPLIKDA